MSPDAIDADNKSLIDFNAWRSKRNKDAFHCNKDYQFSNEDSLALRSKKEKIKKLKEALDYFHEHGDDNFMDYFFDNDWRKKNGRGPL